MIKKKFSYAGLTFLPCGQVKLGFAALSCRIRSDRELKLSKYEWGKGWDYTDFYKSATDKKADIFLCIENGKKYIPGENELFQVL